MLTSPLAFAWPLWRRHRLAVIGCLVYMLFGALVAAIVTKIATDERVINGTMWISSCVVFGMAIYLLIIVSFGYEAEVGARESCYPPSLFRLPIPTAALAIWPIALGALTAAALWLFPAVFILDPWLSHWDIHVALWWPAALAMASLAWLQAMLWMPFGLPMVRVILTCFLIPGLLVLTQIGILSGISEPKLVLLFIGMAAVGWTAGFVGVKYARCGTIPDWTAVLRPWRYLMAHWPRSRRAFKIAERAQVWFEWRRTGGALPTLTALVLPFALVPLVFGKNDAIPTERTLFGALAIPILLSGLAGTTVSGNNRWAKDYYGIAPSTATLPMNTADFVAAKLKAAAWSTAVVWTLLAVSLPAAVLLTKNQGDVADLWERTIAKHEPIKVILGSIAVLIGLIIWTWKRLVDSLLLGLTGRKWIIQWTIGLGMFCFFGILGIAAMAYKHQETREFLVPWLPSMLALVVCCRLAATAWAVRRLLSEKLVAKMTMWTWLIVWLLTATTMFVVLGWAIPHELVSLPYIGFAVIWVLPMARLAATPLALAWNRHR